VFFCAVIDTPLIKDLRRLRVSIDDFDLKGIIGRGQFGEVHVVHERGTKNVYALKILRKDDMQQNVSVRD
jgi:serine/threonine protein kinase